MWSYDQHENKEQELSRAGSLPSCYARPKSIDAWRHRRMLATLQPLIQQFPEAEWLTIGDGKFGSDAYYLQQHHVDVTASSISASTLKIAHDLGYIQKYSAQNAEAISLPDLAVDFVLCKESFHHFPRPPVALYEMLRVARKGVVLIEPTEGTASPVEVVKRSVKHLLRDGASDQFEPSGNFIYRASTREVWKMLTALGHPHLAWKGLNDFWHTPFADASSEEMSMPLAMTHCGIAVQNILARLHLLQYGLGVLVCFKESPDEVLRGRMRGEGYSLMDLPRNPYLST